MAPVALPLRSKSSAPRKSRHDGRNFLVLRFALTSAVLMGLLGAILVTWLTSFIHNTAINHAKDNATYSLALALGTLDINVETTPKLDAAQYVTTTNFLRNMVATRKYVGSVAWTTHDVITYAIEPGRTGRTERPRPEVAEAFAGRVMSLVVHKALPGVPDPTERAGLSSAGPLLEVFAPVRLGGKVLAVAVFYQAWRPVEKQINHETGQMLLLVGASLAVLWIGLVSFVVSAARRLKAQAKANWLLASHDPLTGLPNRKLLRERVERALLASDRSGRKVGLLLFDLDRFKEVNDTLGHHSGDLLLAQIGPRLSGILRDGDSIARLGGDEFVVLLPDLGDATEAETAAERVTEALQESFALDGVSVDVEASIGIAISPEHGIDFDTLLQHADVGMYVAKKSGLPFAAYTAESDQSSLRKLAMLGQLRKAVTDPSQFAVQYQPIADLVTGEVRGVEALTRWKHPAGGVLPPSDFIPLAEQAGLINPLTALILEGVVAQTRAWMDQGLQLPVSVNISSRCLLDAEFPELVAGVLRRHRVPSRLLDLEITESVIMADPDRATAVLAELKDSGLRLAIDDFGTGYSSMGYLKRLPVHRLKIDRSFVTHMTEDSTDAAIVRSCVDLARNLGLTAVAEGVETESVWNQLTVLGCHLAQGFFLAKPMPADQLEGWIADRAKRLAPARERVIRV